MKRRTYLASVASLATLTGASGCISGAAGRNSADRMDKTVTVSNVEQPTDFEVDVNVVDGNITPSTTARVALTYTNTGEDVRTVNLNPENPDPLPSVGKDPGLVLLSDAYDATRTGTECWKPEQEGFPRPAVVYQTPIEPSQSITLEYDVWAAPQQDADCIDPDTYRFEPLYGSFTLTVTTGDSAT